MFRRFKPTTSEAVKNLQSSLSNASQGHGSGKFHIFKGYDKQWYWDLRGRNGNIIAQSEGYQRRGACVNAVNRIKEIAGNAQIVFDD